MRGRGVREAGVARRAQPASQPPVQGIVQSHSEPPAQPPPAAAPGAPGRRARKRPCSEPAPAAPLSRWPCRLQWRGWEGGWCRLRGCDAYHKHPPSTRHAAAPGPLPPTRRHVERGLQVQLCGRLLLAHGFVQLQQQGGVLRARETRRKKRRQVQHKWGEEVLQLRRHRLLPPHPGPKSKPTCWR